MDSEADLRAIARSTDRAPLIPSASFCSLHQVGGDIYR
jgi:hypothetical protein